MRTAALISPLLATMLAAPASARSEKFVLITPTAPQLELARIAFIDAVQTRRVVEIAPSGRTVWRWSAGRVLWHVHPYPNLGERVRDGVYKAARVGRQERLALTYAICVYQVGVLFQRVEVRTFN